MIEEVVLNYLSENLNVPVFTEVPNKDLPLEFVIIEKTGSNRSNYIESATITIQSYAESMYKAASLNEEVKDTMFNIISLANVSRCNLNSDYNYTDTRTKQYRYQAVFNLTYY